VYNRNKGGQDYSDANFISHFLSIAENIRNRRTIKIIAVSKDGRKRRSDVLPLRINYNCANDMFQMIAYYIDEKRKIAVNIDSIRGVEPSAQTITEDDIDERSELKTVVIEIFNKINPYVHMQCFQLFSDYKKHVKYMKERDVYVVEIDYYIFEEADIFKNLLSLGEACKILKPNELAEKIRTRLARAFNLWQVSH
jgi:predicted DNA-binding transcriptional regulator YafY